MKTIHLLFGGMLAALLFPGCASHTAPKAQTVTVIRVKGQARYFVGGKPWQPVKKGERLPLGVTIQTAPKSFVDIEFNKDLLREPPYQPLYNPSSFNMYNSAPSKKCVRIFENSSLTIDRAVSEEHFSWSHWIDENPWEEIWLTLNNGQIMGGNIVSSLDSKYEVRFPKGFVTVSPDSIFMVSSSGVVNVLTGAVSGYLVTKNLAFDVSRREAFDPETGQVTSLAEPSVRVLHDIPENFPSAVMSRSLRRF